MTELYNLRLETGFTHQGNLGVRTNTALYTVGFDQGRITELRPQAEHLAVPAGALDAAGFLGVPPLKDYHIHLDKGHYGGPWQAVIPMYSVAERIQEERGFLRDFLPLLPERAEKVFRLIQSYGCNFFRVQVNVDPVIGLENLRIVRAVLESHKAECDFDLVAFPQHGMKLTELEGFISRALAEGCERVGGVDPATLDQDIEGVLKQTFDLARHYDVPIDLHLHDGGSLGNYEIKRILDYTERYDLAGRVTISHALSLGDASMPELDHLAQRMKALSVSLNTTLPISMAASQRRVMPWVRLLDQGVAVHVVNDNINDHWSCFGTGDLLERVSRAAEIFNQVDEVALNRSYQLVSGGQRTLSAEGSRLWPQIGDPADLLLLNCSCLAEAVARVPGQRRLIHRGQEVALKRPDHP